MRRAVALLSIALAGAAGAAEFRATALQPTTLYDGPSAKAKPRFLYGRDVPVEMIVVVEGWAKVRDAAGTIGWIDRKALSDKRMLVVRVGIADVRAGADDAAPVVFRAEQNVLLELDEPAGPALAPGWIRVRHRDGQSGFLRSVQVFGV